jgi:NhaA family Na+:H+ antiporter
MAFKRIPHIARRVLYPLVEFFRLEAASAIVLFLTAAAALAWANSPWRELYHAIFEGPVKVYAGRFSLSVAPRVVVQDGLMTIFFFVVGMEIKRELAVGELRTLSSAMLPAIAALGGMLVPAAIFAFLNHGGPGSAGWAIPMATDIAFCIGCLTLLKGRVPNALAVFLTALAIFDDMGGVLVIALFYGTGLKWAWLAASAGIAAAVLICNWIGLARWFVYLAAGISLWFTVHHSGINATIAGVVLGLLVPAKPADEAPIEGFIHALHPWVAFGIMPLFALSSSGVELGWVSASSLLSPVLLGAALGLLIGKQVGIFLFTLVSVRLGLAAMPGNARTVQLYGVAVLGGIGFTVALFIASLAFAGEPALLTGAKLGVLTGSLASGLIGYLILRGIPT